MIFSSLSATMPSIFSSVPDDPRASYVMADLPINNSMDSLQLILDILPPLSIKFGPWLAGGAVRRVIQNQSIDDGDVDIFFAHAGEFLKFESALSGFEEIHSSGRAKTFLVHGIKVQLIKRKYYKSLEHLFADFDFSACQVAIDGKNLAYNEEGYQDIQDQKLRFAKVGRVHSHTVIGRMVKYINHGFIPNSGMMKTIISSGLDISSTSTLFVNYELVAANYDHEAKVDEAMDAKVFDSDALRKAAINLGLELDNVG